MAHGIDSTKTPSRPSHEAVENGTGGVEVLGNKTEEEKIDAAAMRGAKRATNRIHADEENIPGSTIFSK